MMILLPIFVIILIIVIIDQIYYPKKEPVIPPQKEVQKTIKTDENATKNYLEKYIKK